MDIARERYATRRKAPRGRHGPLMDGSPPGAMTVAPRHVVPVLPGE